MDYSKQLRMQCVKDFMLFNIVKTKIQNMAEAS